MNLNEMIKQAMTKQAPKAVELNEENKSLLQSFIQGDIIVVDYQVQTVGYSRDNLTPDQFADVIRDGIQTKHYKYEVKPSSKSDKSFVRLFSLREATRACFGEDKCLYVDFGDVLVSTMAGNINSIPFSHLIDEKTDFAKVAVYYRNA